MGLTNFPQGLSSFGIPVYGSQSNGQPLVGQVLFVDTVNGVNAGPGVSPTAPYQTLVYAISQAAANATIFLMPGSTITVADATSTAFNVAGLTIIGMGYGSQRPLFDFTTAATASIVVSVNNVMVQNCRFRASFLSITAPFTLTTATSVMVDNNIFFDTSNVLNFLNIVNSTGVANTIDRISLTNNQWSSLGTTSVNSFLLSANDIDRPTWLNNTIIQATTVDAAILATITAGVITNVNAGYNKGYRNNTTTANGSLINVGGSTSTGIVYNNFVQTLTTTSDKLFTTTSGLAAFDNKVTGVKGASGFLIPTADS